jgi:hypothetical protein
MPFPASLGLETDVWKLIFEKSRRLALWDARVARLGEQLRQSWGRWIDVHTASPDEPHPIIVQRAIFFACRFKLMEVTKSRLQEETDVSLYVYDLCSRVYVFMDDIEMMAIFEDDHSSDEEEFLEGEEDVE